MEQGQDQMITLTQPLTSNIVKDKKVQKMNIQSPNEIQPVPVEKTDPKFDRYWNIIRQKLIDRKQTEQKINKYHQLFLESRTNKQIDRALGSVYGAMIGDALGAYCEFNYQLSDKVVDQAMKMPGGGTFDLEAGQFTDDSQMATHLLLGLSHLNTEQPLLKQHYKLISRIALQYLNWNSTTPFDIGNTCSTAIYILIDHYHQKLQSAQTAEGKPEFFKKMYQQIYHYNKNSLANGSLMRISPLALFFSMTGKNPLQYSQFIKDQVALTHPNSLLQDAGVFWVNLLTMLINRKSDQNEEFQQILNKSISDNHSERLKDWIQQASKEIGQSMQANSQMGFAKIAFSYGLKALFNIVKSQQTKLDATFYTSWIKWIIKKAGDTDTNAAIAGGLIGSIIGFWNLPQDYVVTTLKTITDGRTLVIQDLENSDPKKKFKNPKRPSYFQPTNVSLLALDVIQKCRVFSQNQSK